MNALLVFAGGGVGAVLRYLLFLVIPLQPLSFPLPTLIVNALGSLLIGYVAVMLPLESTQMRLFLMTGVLGGFTTYSAFSVENAALVQSGMIGTALLYTALTLALCFAGVALGFWLGKGFAL